MWVGLQGLMSYHLLATNQLLNLKHDNKSYAALNFHFGPGMHNVIALKLDHCTHPAQHKWLGLLESSLGVPCSTMYHT